MPPRVARVPSATGNVRKLTSARPLTPARLGFYMPAEWSEHAATWLAWPHEQSDWPGKFQAIPWVFAEMARHLQEAERLRILVGSELDQRRAERCLTRAGVSASNVEFFEIPTDRSWTRDFLPLFVVRRERGRVKEAATVKWRFNGWARYPNHERDEAAGVQVAEHAGFRTFLAEATLAGKRQRVVLEGGAIDVDGEGTLLATRQCLLTGPQARNRELGSAGIERVVRDYLGVEKMIWLPDGIAGDDTSGHIDDFARFVAPGRVVLCQEKRREDPNHAVLCAAEEQLRAARDARGRRLEVIALPMPAPVYFDGQRLPASYANFYVGNATVLVPTFNDPHDRLALGILSELFPSRKVVGIHALDLVLGLGTIHCSTQQEPAAPLPDAHIAERRARARRKARRAA
ncbi:MAG TPA: agmatine deiminase family protein [Polyangiaceae bacterium]